ncbi:hypothetical protein EBU99_13915, partial [bacterium]|nr:hypothetical protein [bacterium]
RSAACFDLNKATVAGKLSQIRSIGYGVPWRHLKTQKRGGFGANHAAFAASTATDRASKKQ